MKPTYLYTEFRFFPPLSLGILNSPYSYQYELRKEHWCHSDMNARMGVGMSSDVYGKSKSSGTSCRYPLPIRVLDFLNQGAGLAMKDQFGQAFSHV